MPDVETRPMLNSGARRRRRAPAIQADKTVLDDPFGGSAKSEDFLKALEGATPPVKELDGHVADTDKQIGPQLTDATQSGCTLPPGPEPLKVFLQQLRQAYGDGVWAKENPLIAVAHSGGDGTSGASDSADADEPSGKEHGRAGDHWTVRAGHTAPEKQDEEDASEEIDSPTREISARFLYDDGLVRQAFGDIRSYRDIIKVWMEALGHPQGDEQGFLKVTGLGRCLPPENLIALYDGKVFSGLRLACHLVALFDYTTYELRADPLHDSLPTPRVFYERLLSRIRKDRGHVPSLNINEDEAELVRLPVMYALNRKVLENALASPVEECTAEFDLSLPDDRDDHRQAARSPAGKQAARYPSI